MLEQLLGWNLQDAALTESPAAETLLAEIRNTVRTWRDHANQLTIPRHEQETMAPAFDS